MAYPHSSSGDLSPATNYDVVVRQTLNPAAPFFFPMKPSIHYHYFSPPPFYFISDLPPPPSIFVCYPFWCIKPYPNPSRFASLQERPPLYSQSRIQELPPRKRVFPLKGSNGSGKKLMCRKARSGGDHVTTVMLRNIPNKFTREMMIGFLDEHCVEENRKEKDEGSPISAYDFLYLPIDFESRMNKGYAFVNFTNSKAVTSFRAACNNMPWSCLGSRKVLEVVNARIQGKDELVKHFQQMKYPDEAYSALSFNPARRGPKNTVLTIMVGKCTNDLGLVVV